MPDKELDLQWTKEQEEYVNTLKKQIDLYKSLEKQIDETETKSNVELKKEITEIKSYGISLTVLEKLLKVKEENEQLKSKIIELNEQIEKMKNCRNCFHMFESNSFHCSKCKRFNYGNVDTDEWKMGV